jgi:hypothetical protein
MIQLSFLPALASVGNSVTVFGLFHHIVLTAKLCIVDRGMILVMTCRGVFWGK